MVVGMGVVVVVVVVRLRVAGAVYRSWELRELSMVLMRMLIAELELLMV